MTAKKEAYSKIQSYARMLCEEAERDRLTPLDGLGAFAVAASHLAASLKIPKAKYIELVSGFYDVYAKAHTAAKKK